MVAGLWEESPAMLEQSAHLLLVDEEALEVMQQHGRGVRLICVPVESRPSAPTLSYASLHVRVC